MIMCRLLMVLLFLLCASRLVSAQDQGPDPSTRAERQRLEAQGVSAFNRGDLEGAERAFRAWHELRPSDWIPLYNLATVVSGLGRTDEAAELLGQSVSKGFVDFRLLERDGAMRRLAESAVYRDLMANWRARQDEAIGRRIEQARRGFAKTYRFDRDEEQRLAFASGFSESSFGRVREEITRLSRFFAEQVLPEGEVVVQAKGEKPEPWVMVVLPTPADYTAWAKRNYGVGWQQVGGVYDQDRRELVAKDLGPTFRHEFFHVLHWRHINRLPRGQPAWVMEGLCSLVEDVRVNADGTLTPRPSWRTNTVKRLVESGNPPSLRAMLGMSDAAFTGARPLANYALARALFLFLYERGKLRAWYGDYTSEIKDDQTGRNALERAFNKPLGEIEKELLEWVRGLPMVPDAERPPAVALPLSVGVSTGDGLRVNSVLRSAGAIRTGDVVTAVAGQSVADGNDLARILGELAVGDEVEVEFRRGTREQKAKLKVVAR